MSACIDIIGCDITESFVVTPVVVVLDEGFNRFLQLARHFVGHSSIQITLDTYLHVVATGLQQVAAVRFDEAFSTRYNEPENEPVEKSR